MRIRWLIFALAAFSLAAHADGIYRCKIDGKTVYAASCPVGELERPVKIWRGPTDDDIALSRSQSEAAKEKLSVIEQAQAKQAAKDKAARRKRASKRVGKTDVAQTEEEETEETSVRVRNSVNTRAKAKFAAQ